MRWLLPDRLVCALAGFGLGFLATFSLRLLKIDASGWSSIGLGIVGAVIGYIVGSGMQSASVRMRAVSRWCVITAVILGSICFLIGFVGPIVLQPDSPQGPLLGIFFTGPLGTLAGAALGAVIGLLVPASAAATEGLRGRQAKGACG